MRVLVTEVAGPLGSEVASLLLAEGHHVVGLDPLTRNHRDAVPVHPFMTFREAAYTGESVLPSEVQGVVHCELYRSPRPEETVASAVTLARKYRSGVVLFSVLRDMFPPALVGPITEETLPQPRSDRAAVALLCETAFALFAPSSVSLRVGEVYQDDHTLLAAMLEAARVGRPAVVPNGGRDVEPRVSAHDAARAACRALASSANPATYHVHDGLPSHATTILEALSSLGMGYGAEYTSERTPPSQDWYALSDLAASTLGWLPQWDLREYLRTERDAWTGDGR